MSWNANLRTPSLSLSISLLVASACESWKPSSYFPRAVWSGTLISYGSCKLARLKISLWDAKTSAVSYFITFNDYRLKILLYDVAASPGDHFSAPLSSARGATVAVLRAWLCWDEIFGSERARMRSTFVWCERLALFRCVRRMCYCFGFYGR